MSDISPNKSNPARWYLWVPALVLALSTTMLSVIAVTNSSLFFSSMGWAFPSDPNLTLSWAVRNSAVALVLWFAVIFRTPSLLAVAYTAHLAMDAGDLVVDLVTKTPLAPPLPVFAIVEVVLLFVLIRQLVRAKEGRS